MKKLLFVLPWLPYPLSAGGNQAMYNNINAVKNDFEVIITYCVSSRCQNEQNRKKMEQCLGNVKIVPFIYNPYEKFSSQVTRKIESVVEKVRSKIEGFDYKCSKMSEVFSVKLGEFASFIASYVEQNNVDIVQLEMCSCLPYALCLPPHVKKIFVHHELRYVANELRVQSAGITPVRQANFELAKILEIGLLNKCDAVVTLSDTDRQKLISEGVNAPIYTSFAVVNTETTSCNPNDVNNVLSFIGPATHSPNYVGIKWFLENCWDALLSSDPSYRLKIIGKWSEERRKELLSTYRNIDFAGFVPDLAESLNNTVMIVPITIGSGIRMKILEASSLGVPFVSTTVGAEGLPFESGRDCLKGDSPKEFVDAVLKMRDKSLRMEFAKNANALVKEKYSMEALRRNRLEIYEKVMNGE